MNNQKRGDSRPRLVITGAAGGVGRACARLFADLGAELVLIDHDGPGLHEVARATGAFARFCDIASEASLQILAVDLLDRFGKLHVLINAAGSGYVRSLGMMRMSRALLPALRGAAGPKVIVNVAPRPCIVSNSGLFKYAGSDGAFARLSEAIALQLRGSSIRTATVVPGAGYHSAQQLELQNACAAEKLVVADPDAHVVAARIADHVCNIVPELCRDRLEPLRKAG